MRKIILTIFFASATFIVFSQCDQKQSSNGNVSRVVISKDKDLVIQTYQDSSNIHVAKIPIEKKDNVIITSSKNITPNNQNQQKETITTENSNETPKKPIITYKKDTGIQPSPEK